MINASSMPGNLRTVNAAGDPPPSLLDEMATGINSAIKDVADLASQLRERADGIFGTQPEPASGINKAAQATARASELRDSLNSLHDVIATTRGQVRRFAAL